MPMLTNESVTARERVIDEKLELDRKIERLQHYLRYSALPHQFMILKEQKVAMLQYSKILGERLDTWR